MQPTTDAPNLAETLLQQAVSLARQGFRVFPLEVDGSTPAFAGWQDKASSNETLVLALWRSVTGEAIPYNIGIRTGDGLTVLDVDTKKNRAGAESLDDLVTFQGLEDATYTVRTKSGGFHLYYRSAGQRLKNSVGQIAPGLDIRSDGGYVVAPGSTVGETSYAVVKPLAIFPIQPWFAELCGTAHAKGETAQPLVELDTPDAVARATDWLRNTAPVVTADSGNGDITAYKVACGVKDFGISEHECLALILEHFDEVKSHPPQGQEVWERKVENAYRHGLSAPGVRNPMADFEVEELMAPSVEAMPTREGLYALPALDAIARTKDRKRAYLVKGLLGAGVMSFLFGDSGVGKTFVMLDIAIHVSLGLPWNGKRTVKSPVLYVAAEGAYDIGFRLEAWAKHHGVDLADAWLSIVPCPVDLRSTTADTKQLIALAKSEAERFAPGSKPGLVVVDTYSRAMAGGDENSTVDSGIIVKHLDAIKSGTGAHVGTIHHSGKDASRGMRGSGLLRAATDTEIELRDGMLTATKQRSMRDGETMAYRLRTLGLGVDDEGDELTSCVALFGAAAEMADDAEGAGPNELTAGEVEWLAQLEAGIGDMAEEKATPLGEYSFTDKAAGAIFYQATSSGQRDGQSLPRMTVRNRLTKLAAKGAVKKGKRNQWFLICDHFDDDVTTS